MSDVRFDVFLSYNSSDKPMVEALARRLRADANLNPFLDRWHLVPGDPWQEAIEEALAASDSVAVVIGPSGVSPWHHEEMRAAIDRAVRERAGFRVIPVLLPDADEGLITGFLARRTWVDHRAGLSDAVAFKRLVAGIRGEAPDDPAAVGVPIAAEAPWYDAPAGDADDCGPDGLSSLTSRVFADPSDARIRRARDVIGRSAELERLRTLFGRVQETGRGSVCILVGPRGFGKLVLAREFLTQVQLEGNPVFATGFDPRPPRRTHEPWRTLERRYPNALDMAGTPWLDLMDQAAAIGRATGAPTPAAPDSPDAALARALRGAVEHGWPCVVFLDGYEHAEATWRTLLLLLATEMAVDLPILVLVSTDSQHVGSDLARTLQGRVTLDMIGLGRLSSDDVRSYAEGRLDGPVVPGLAWALGDRAEGVPVWVEDLLDEWMSGRIPVAGGALAPALRFDDAQGAWCAIPEARSLVFTPSWELARQQLARVVPQTDTADWAAAMEILGCAAWQGPTFAVEVVASALGISDEDRLIDWLDEVLVQAADGSIISEVDNPKVGGRQIHRYRFTSRRIWAAWRHYGLGRDRLRSVLPAIAEQVGVIWIRPDALADERSVHVGALVDLFRKAVEVDPYDPAAPHPDGHVDWAEMVEWYEHQLRLPDRLAGLVWQARVMGESGRRRSEHDERLWFETLLMVANRILGNLAGSEAAGAPGATAQARAALEVPVESMDDGAHASAEDAVWYVESAVGVAKALRDARRQARASSLARVARLASEMTRRESRDDARRLLKALLATSEAAVDAGTGQWDADAIQEDLRAALAQSALRVMEDPMVDQATRIAAGLVLGDIGDPRFEHWVQGPFGVYVEPPMVAIPAGTYVVGSRRDDPEAETDEFDEHAVDLHAFEIGRFPVTNAEFACFIDAGGYDDEQWWETALARTWLNGDPEQAAASRQEWRDLRRQWEADPDFRERWVRGGIADEDLDTDRGVRERRRIVALSERQFEATAARWYPGTPVKAPEFWTDPEFNNPTQPVVGVSWYEARAYCAWLSAQTGRECQLPSEVQWEAAARGPEGRRYPFSDAFVAGVANVANVASSHVACTSPVGAFPMGCTPTGICDLCGNVWEWTRSLYDRGDGRAWPYPYKPGDTAREDPSAPVSWHRVVRGGSWDGVAHDARAADRGRGDPGNRSGNVGFRVVRAAPIS